MFIFFFASLISCDQLFLIDWFRTAWNATATTLTSDGTIDESQIITYRLDLQDGFTKEDLVGELRSIDEFGVHKRICQIQLKFSSLDLSVEVNIAPPESQNPEDFETFVTLNGTVFDDENDFRATGVIDNEIEYSLVFMTLNDGEIQTFNRKTKEVIIYRFERPEQFKKPNALPQFIPIIMMFLIMMIRLATTYFKMAKEQKAKEETEREKRIKAKRKKN
ncbi:hypothetical protein TRFO_30094 [Tritrichomonas foetus]|uniref:Uncharacterized protein n=1 Tax=Tritrichomonas foetus TaxID=1144522 RepID=A0A1J4JUA0_9EUKA|nr:hypothetical protein TRFO_30094 [Tritrichomonas foetus]|eukprot:OHT02727.1 hypothetical protein TRFO_30094 [Tritrichomonas foetus]